MCSRAGARSYLWGDWEEEVVPRLGDMNLGSNKGAGSRTLLWVWGSVQLGAARTTLSGTGETFLMWIGAFGGEDGEGAATESGETLLHSCGIRGHGKRWNCVWSNPCPWGPALFISQIPAQGRQATDLTQPGGGVGEGTSFSKHIVCSISAYICD